jgi:geranylgeranyl diphosphate synthase type I
MSITRERFIQELQQRDAWVLEVLNRPEYRDSFAPEALRDAVYSYLNRPAKRLRPGILFFCCGAAGGREELARQAAASVEVYHTWTLVHDDIIDNDPKRRGQPTVHEEYRLKALEWGYGPEAAAQLGKSVAILAGDLQHAWAVWRYRSSSILLTGWRSMSLMAWWKAKRWTSSFRGGLFRNLPRRIFYGCWN